MKRVAIGVAALAFMVGCGEDAGGTGDAGTAIDAPGSTPDAFEPPTGFTKLIGRDWSLQPGQLDTYRCARVTIAADTYLTNILAEAPQGTHHTVLSISDGSTAGPDGEYNCNVGELGMVMLYASGLGTSPLDFPTDVSVRIPAGTQIHLNLHLFNATDNAISGTSGIFVKSQATPTTTLAEMVFAGRIAFGVPSNTPPTPTNITGGCTVNTPYSLFAVWPHMHQLATHQKVEIIRSGTPAMVLHDQAFDFNEQNYYAQTPIVQVQANDQVRVTCTFLNDTGQLVTFGDSSNQEMCFAGLYRYPAANAGLFQCTDQPNFPSF